MKKLILSTAIIFGSFTAFAQEATSTPQNQSVLQTDATAKTQQTATTTQQTTNTPQNQVVSQTDATAKTKQTATTTQEEYTEVKMEEVPEAVTKAFKESYPDAIMGKVFVNANKEYKIKITLGDKSGVVYADANGKWLEK
jgi:cytoskeletal protein RodZ